MLNFLAFIIEKSHTKVRDFVYSLAAAQMCGSPLLSMLWYILCYRIARLIDCWKTIWESFWR